ncbi:hypothetical protein ID852_03190 [Xenorhabdus sp. 42]|uniref:hypothetical protein n=1 Tax=Xenorhabdus szentirmaii TaxID=290112 RepID=UPI001984B3FC|nr:MULTISPECIES: hypothetical protein [unclassified Xenorhabdus]MBD2782203.1 hypothetical protein [Xenorhabdus sp. 38]MBD2819712.1 hypothetical protein [Xenorhabdus sp. 42]
MNHDENNDILMRLKSLKLAPLGQREVSGFRGIDIAVGNHIAACLKGLTVNQPDRHNQGFMDFIRRPASDQVLLGHFDDIKDFIRTLRQAKAGRKSQSDNPYANPDALPVINLSRTMDYDVMPNDRQIKRDRYGEVFEDNTVVAVLDAHPVNLVYDIVVLSAEKEPLSLLCNAIAIHFATMISTGFHARVNIAHAEVDIECAFNDAREIAFSDVSLPVMEDRLFGAKASIKVQADIIMAHAVVPRVEKTVVNTPKVTRRGHHGTAI